MRLLILIGYWLALAAATHYPRVQIPGEFQWRDKLVHIACFGLLAGLFWRFLTRRTEPGPRTAWLAAAVLVPYAALDEYTQQFVGRHTELADWIANVTGIATVLVACEIRRRVR